MRRKNNKSSIGFLILLTVIIGAVLFVYTSDMFEREVPKISMKNNGYWNLKKPLEVDISDNSGIKSYKVILKSKDDEKTLYYEQFINPKGSVKLKVEPPRSAYAIKDKKIKIIIEATDVSKWNLLKGNSIIKDYTLYIDKKRPQLTILNNSYKINKGGSAVVIFKAKDENIKDIYIQTNFGKKFIPQPFYKDGYYISLLAWPLKNSSFRATVVATDEAGNVSKSYIPLYLKNKKYRVSKIRLSDRFLHGKIAQLAEEFEETQGVEDPLEQFVIINETVRAKNEGLIHELTSKVSDEMIMEFNMHKMYPLKNGQVVASFGDHRKYYYKDKYISESYHLGLDLASYALAAIKPQNGGNVVYASYNGLYGKMPIVDHGMGLYTLYGHCSSVNVTNGDIIKKNEKIASTGKSGYAMGDHLHFGVLVQGVEVRPAEWMDKGWIKLNISDIMDNAKKIIDRQ